MIKKEKAKKKNAQIFEKDVIIQNKIDELNESRQILNLSDFNNSSEESEIEVKE